MAAIELDAPQISAPREGSRARGDRRLVARAGLALVLANGRYWTSVAPIVRGELKRWRVRAGAIDDPQLRALALAKLDGEGFHAEAAAMLATCAPREHRRSVVEAIVALELLFDYLDGLTELPCRDPLSEGDRLFRALNDAVSVPAGATIELAEQPLCDDGGYLEELSLAVSQAVARLPAASAITEVARRTASLSGMAQTRMHAASQLGVKQLEEWARGQAQGNELGWREFVAGCASSILVLHALIAAGADPRTSRRDAAQIEDAYRFTCVVLTLLDGLVDHDRDIAHDGSDRPGYLSLFEDRDELSQALVRAARRAATQARELPNGAHHMMLLTGVVAYYGSDPGAEGELAAPVIARLKGELGPLMAPTLGIMRAWRGSRRRAGSFGPKGEDGS
jgi:tetraprenyl-beta-curcumene synthase